MKILAPLEQATELTRKGERAEARSILEGLISQKPDAPEAWLLLFRVLDNPIIIWAHDPVNRIPDGFMGCNDHILSA